MSKFIAVLIVALMFEAIGVIGLRKGLQQVGEPSRISLPEIGRLLVRGVTNRYIIGGIALEAIFFAGLLYLLSQKDVSVVWPLTALGFVVTTLAARFFLKENVGVERWAGILLIVTGAALITWSEQKKKQAGESALLQNVTTPLHPTSSEQRDVSRGKH